MATNVPVPVFGATGFIVPAESAVLAGVQADINTAFGGGLNFTTQSGSAVNSTPQNQLASSLAAIIGNVYDTFLYYTTQTDPAYAEGRMQDAIGRIYFITRIPASPTTIQCLCSGLPTLPIPAGAIVVDQNNNLYTNQGNAVPIGVNGSVSVTFTQLNLSLGPLPIPTSVTIYQAVAGWDSATVIAGTIGIATESRTAFEQRRQQTVAQNSVGSLASVLGVVRDVPGVVSAYVTENVNGTATVVNGTVLVANSLYVCAYGGSNASIGTAIWTRKGPGCNYNGNTTVTVQDQSPGYIPPYPSYNVTFMRPFQLQILYLVKILNSSAVPNNAVSLVQNALLGAFVGNDGGPAAQIGGTLQASRMIPPVANLGNWAQGNIVELEIGSANDADACLCTGSCSGTTLTISSITSGTISLGQTVTDFNGLVIAGTTIVAQVSGSVGGPGVYTISMAQTFANLSLGLSTPDETSTSVKINQMPILSASNIQVVFI